MDKDDKPSGGLPNVGLIWVALAAAGALFISTGPLRSSRPTLNEPRPELRASAQDIDARLWQDPFGAVARARAQALKTPGMKPEDERRQHEQACFTEELRRQTQASLPPRADKATPTPAAAEQVSTQPPDASPRAAESAPVESTGCAAAAAAEPPGSAAPAPASTGSQPSKTGPRVVVLAVMLFGGPYAEQVESRRRTRYAVLAGLNARGFAPLDNEHLGYFYPARGAGRALPETVPFEVFMRDPSGSRHENDCDRCRLVVLWLDSTPFYERPLERLLALADQTTPRPERQGDPPAVRWRVLGPTSSAGLKALVDEMDGQATPATLSRHDMRLFSASATAPDKSLLPKDSRFESVSEFLADKKVPLLRTTPTDDDLARKLIEELKLRGLKTRKPGDARPDIDCEKDDTPLEDLPSSIAIVSEWDTLYGRTLRQQFRYSVPREARIGREGFCTTRWQYLRGLDGNLPGEATPEGVDARPKAEAKQDGANAIARDGSYAERPEGQSQYDYLRRLATRIREEDAAMRKLHGPEHGIRAIGVLGNDVYDKLLVLQALQTEMPQAIFFTTDLDARLFHPREQAWARNLIVASGFGLRLAEELQRGVPPLRDSYQTSTFLATQLAVADAGRAFAVPGYGLQPSQQEIDKRWLDNPRLFEISRSGAFDFSDPRPPKRKCDRWSLDACDDVHPPGNDPAPEPALAVRLMIVGPLLLLLWLPALALNRGVGRRLRRFVVVGGSRERRVRRRLGLYVGFAALAILPTLLAAWAWPHATVWMTLQGKPISMTDGISPWPTYGIRFATLLLALYFVFRGWSALSSNSDRIARALRLTAARRVLTREALRETGQRTRWQQLMAMLSVRPPRPQGQPHAGHKGLSFWLESPPMAPISIAAADFWKHYIVQNQARARVLRTGLCMLVLLPVGLLVRWGLGGAPIAPQRGPLTPIMHLVSTIPTGFVTLFLIFFVADATLLCVFFVRGLRRHRASWPDRTLQCFHARTGIPKEHLNDWISLEFVARRTRCVGALIYYPFIVLSLLVASRSAFFDDWFTPPSFIVLATLSFSIVLLCAFALRHTAEASRQEALKHLRDALLRAKGSANSALEKQLDAMRDRIERLDVGAFAPYSQQPLLKAVLLPLLTFGGSSLFDYLSMFGF